MVFLLALIGMICWGIAPIFVKLGLKDVNPLIGLFVRTTFTLIVISGWMFLDGSITKVKNLTPTALTLLAAEAVFATLIGDLAYFAAIKRGAVSLVTIIMSSSPLITIICSIIFLGEHVTMTRLLGTGLIIIGIVLAI